MGELYLIQIILIIFLMLLNLQSFLSIKKYCRLNKKYIYNNRITAKVWAFNIILAICFCSFIFQGLMLFLGIYASSLLSFLILYFMYLSNKLKFKILKEPLCFSDLLLAKEAITHPKLYFAYARLSSKLLLFIAVIALIGIAILDRNLYYVHPHNISLLVISFCFLVFISSIWGLRCFANVSYKSTQDALFFFPLLSFFLSIGMYIDAKINKEQILLKAKEKLDKKADSLIDIEGNFLLIQGESLLYEGVKKYLDNKDNELFASNTKIKLQKLDIYYQGAYTMRSEFEMLSGIDSSKLKGFCNNPYELLFDLSKFNLVQHFKAKGYKCIAMHPNQSFFFKRDKIFKALGFDEFYDLNALKSLNRVGLYTSDYDLIKFALDKFSEDKKTFIFVITMQTHGPFHKGYIQNMPKLCDSEAYYYHLQYLMHGVKLIEDSGIEALIYSDHIPYLQDLSHESLHPGLISINIKRSIEDNIKISTLSQMIN